MLDEVTSAHPGIESLLLDIDDRDSIRSFGQQRHQLKGTTDVIDIIPPYVQTPLSGEAFSDPRTANSHRTQ